MSGPISNPDPTTDIASAELIVVGTVARVGLHAGAVSLVAPGARAPDDELFRAELDVVRVLAGKPPGPSLGVLFVRSRTPARAWLELEPHQTVLLFLRSVAGGHAPVNPTGTPIRTLVQLPAAPPAATRTQAVAHELEQIVLRANPAAQRALIVQACQAHAGMRAAVDLAVLGQPALDATTRLAWVALALAAGQVDALSELNRLVASPAWPADGGLQSVIVQSTSQLRDPAARSALAALIQGRSVELARAAAMALRQLRIRDAEPDLIRALDHADQAVRYQAVMGLAELEPSAGEAPSFAVYQADEARYLQRWKRWAAQRSPRP